MLHLPVAISTPILSTIVGIVHLAALSGCEESKQMGREMADLKDHVQKLQEEETRVEDDIKKMVSGYAALSNNSLIRKSGATLEQKRDTATAELAALKKQRDQLKSEVDAINKATAAYRQKYL